MASRDVGAADTTTVVDWLRSVPTAGRDLFDGRTRCVDDLLGVTLQLHDGRTYEVFRHTRKDEAAWVRARPAAVVHPRFR